MLLIASALAGSPQEQHIVYDIRYQGQSVGRREVTLTYLDSPKGEVRILESWTTVQAEVAGKTVTWRNRSSARMSETSSSFTSSVDEAGTVRDVQGRLMPTGRWRVTITEGSESKTWDLRATEVTVSSLGLLDPERRMGFTRSLRPGVLVVETGAVMGGRLEELDEGTVDVGGRQVAVQRFEWTPEEGRAELAWSHDGLLVAYDMLWNGLDLSVVATELPETRSYGSIEGVGVTQVEEEEL